MYILNRCLYQSNTLSNSGEHVCTHALTYIHRHRHGRSLPLPIVFDLPAVIRKDTECIDTKSKERSDHLLIIANE